MKVRFTRDALADLDSALTYIRSRSPAGAKRIRSRILEVIRPLRRFPGIGTATDDEGTRMLVATPYPYLIFYEIDYSAREVIILHVRHGARDRDG
jgi:plasmid stabilization system protein ParE